MRFWDSLGNPANPNGRLTFVDDRHSRQTNWGELIKQAERVATGLRKRGVGPGASVACVLTNSFDVCAGLFGIWLAGGTVISLPTPARGLPLDEYVGQLQGLCRKADAHLLVLEDEFATNLVLPHGPTVVGFGELPADGPVSLSPVGLDEPAFVQCSSGSTSGPKGCVLTPRAMAAQVDMLIDRLDVDPAYDSGYSWLPLSHDMGLFGGFLTAFVSGGAMTLGSPLRFLRSPGTWLRDCAASGATVTVGPNFGLALALRAARRMPPKQPVSLRTWILGSDPIEAGVLEEATRLLVPLGAPSTTLTPAYGMAEATLAVSMTTRYAEPSSITVGLDALYDGKVAEPGMDELTTRVVSCGPPVADTAIRIDGPGDVGEIVVRSPSLATHYLGDPERSAHAFTADGEYRTGDIGFLRDGELYVIGRVDDMMSVGGRNIIAGEIESRMTGDPRVRPGGCVLIDVDLSGKRQLVVLSEPSAADVDFVAVAQEMRRTAAEVAGVGIHECIFVPRGSLPKSPSGKIQRFRCRSLAANPEAVTLARVRVG